jgi:Zn-dependent protease with chaperone function
MIDATYFDGICTRRHPVTVVIHKRIVAMRGAGIHRSERLSSLEISERLQAAPRILRFADGAFIEVEDQQHLDRMLAANRFIEPRVVRWQNNWPLSLAALVSVVVILAATYNWGLPLAADTLAQNMPADMEKKFGDASLEQMDQELMAPSKLPVAEQARLAALFAAMVQPNGGKTPYRLLFRASGVGPNAFALPNGVIVMTDELVQDVGNDDAILGVLSHELGHLRGRHSARQVLRTIGVGLALNLWVGDVSSALAAVPTILVTKKYSREFEREADSFAIAMMGANDRSLAPMAAMFEQMEHDKTQREAQGTEALEQEEEAPPAQRPAPDYFATHPSDAERVLKLRAAELRRQAAAMGSSTASGQ